MNRCFFLALLAVIFLANLTCVEAVEAKIKTDQRAYAKRPLTLNSAGSTQGNDVTYKWTVTSNPSFQGAPPAPAIGDADKAVAHFTPPAWGVYNFTLTVTQGAEHQDAKFPVHVFNDPAKDDSPTYDGETKILYKQAPDTFGAPVNLYLHVFNAPGWKATDKRGAVLLFHGGAWVSGSPDRYVPDAKYWASRGLIGITDQYRLGGREGTPVDDCVADAKSAVRYLRAHATELGIDPQKIAVGGESAGAHIAACTGTVPAYNDPKDDLTVSCVPNALLLYFPFQMISDRGNKKDDMSPLHFVTTSTPPTLFIGGEMDGIAPAERGIDWGNQMKGGTNEFRFFIYRKAHHPSGHQDMTKPGDDNDIIRQTDLFLVSLGFMTGDPSVPPMDAEAIAKLHVDPKDYNPEIRSSEKKPAPAPTPAAVPKPPPPTSPGST